MTRLIKDTQLQFGQTPIEEIKFNPRSRDDIPQILQGLQYLYITPEIRTLLFSTLERLIPEHISQSKGRRGMELWKIFVMGTLRVNLNWDYDRLHEMANTHKTIRQMLGHGLYDDDKQYSLQTLKDNVQLFTPEILDEINIIIVKAGHGLLKKKDTTPILHGRCDSFVVETDVHYPTDINLLYDAMRKVIGLSGQLCEKQDDTDWRQHVYHQKRLKHFFRKAQKIKKATYQNSARQVTHDTKLKEVYSAYIARSSALLQKAENTRNRFKSKGLMNTKGLLIDMILQKYMVHARRQIDQIVRRVLDGEVIPHSEKVFSLFEPHTEWVSKGKAKAPVELGKRVCILEDQFGFILHHSVMENQVDNVIAVSMVEATKQRFVNLSSCSFDKGFYSPENRTALQSLLEEIILPKKGRLTQAEKEVTSSPAYIQRRYQHAAVESAINALEIHGLDRCLDHGLPGFKRYVGLAVVARNIQQIGAIRHSQKKKKLLLRKAA